MTSQPGKQTVTIHILFKISQEIKAINQAMKFSQFLEYSMKIFFLKNPIQNVVEKLFPNPFLKNKN